jgi:hypothetical protein
MKLSADDVKAYDEIIPLDPGRRTIVMTWSVRCKTSQSQNTPYVCAAKVRDGLRSGCIRGTFGGGSPRITQMYLPVDSGVNIHSSNHMDNSARLPARAATN